MKIGSHLGRIQEENAALGVEQKILEKINIVRSVGGP